MIIVLENRQSTIYSSAETDICYVFKIVHVCKVCRLRDNLIIYEATCDHLLHISLKLISSLSWSISK